MIGNRKGKLAEDIAERFLTERGYSIIHRNYWKPYGEIDIIARMSDRIHFIEVKSVFGGLNHVSHENIRPEDNVHPAKLKKLARVIEVYIRTFHVKSWQFDVAIVYVDEDSKKANVNLIENQILEARN